MLVKRKPKVAKARVAQEEVAQEQVAQEQVAQEEVAQEEANEVEKGELEPVAEQSGALEVAGVSQKAIDIEARNVELKEKYDSLEVMNTSPAENIQSKLQALALMVSQEETKQIQNKVLDSHHAQLSQQMQKDDEEQRELRKQLYQEQQLSHQKQKEQEQIIAQQQLQSASQIRSQLQEQHQLYPVEAIVDEQHIAAVAVKSLADAQEMQVWVEGRVNQLHESRFFALVSKYHASALAADESSLRSRQLLEACEAQEKAIWSIQQSTRVSHGVCGDGRAVTHSLPIAVAQCDEQALSQYATLVQAHVDNALVLLPSHKHALLSSRLAFELHFHDFFKTGAPSDDSAARIRDYLDVLFHFERVSQRRDSSTESIVSTQIADVESKSPSLQDVAAKSELNSFRSAIRYRILQLVEALYKGDLARATFNQKFIWVHLLRTSQIGTWASLEKLVPQCELGSVLRTMLLLLCGVERPPPPNEEWVQVDLDPSSNFWVSEEDLITLLQVLDVNQVVVNYAAKHSVIDLIEECRVICKILVEGLAKIPAGLSQFALLIGKLLCDLTWTVAKQVFPEESKRAVDSGRVQDEFDALCSKVAFGLLHASQTSLRYFLSELPYAHLSLRARNRMFLAIFEGGAKDEHLTRSRFTFVDWVQSPQLQKRRELFVELICKGQDGVHLANALTELAKQLVALLFREQGTCSCSCIHQRTPVSVDKPSSGSDLPLIVVVELFHVAFIDSSARSLFWRESQQLFASICSSHPSAISLLLSLVTSQISFLGPAAKMLFATQLPLADWQPSLGDMSCLEQLLCTTLSSDSSKLGTYLVSYLSERNNMVEIQKDHEDKSDKKKPDMKCECTTHRHLLTMLSRVRFFHHARVVAASFSLIKTNQFTAPSAKWWTNTLLGFQTHSVDQMPLVGLLSNSLASLHDGCCISESSFTNVISARVPSQTPLQVITATTISAETGEERVRGFQNRSATIAKDPVLAYLQLMLTTFGSDVALFAQRGWPLLECLLDPGLKLRADRPDYQPLMFRVLRDLLPCLIVPASPSLFPPEFSLTEALFASLRPRGLQYAVSWWTTLENRPTKGVCEQLIAVMSCQIIPRIQTQELGAVVGFWLGQVVLGSSGAANQRKYPECDVAWLKDPDYSFLVDSLCRFALLSITQDASNGLFSVVMEFCRRVCNALQVKDRTVSVLDVIRRADIPAYSGLVLMMLLAETEIGLSGFRDVGFIVAGSGELSGLEGILAPSLTVNGAKTFIRKSLVRRWADVVPLFEFDNCFTPLAWQGFFVCYFLRADTTVVVHAAPIHRLLASNLDRLLACSNEQYKYFASRFLFEDAEGMKLVTRLKQALSQLSEVSKPTLRPLYHAMMLWLSMGDVNAWMAQMRSKISPNAILEASLSDQHMPYVLSSLLENSFVLPSTLWSQYLPFERLVSLPLARLPKTEEEQPARATLTSALATGRTLRSHASTGLRTYTPAAKERNPSESLNVFVLHEWLTLSAWQLAQLDDKDGCIRAQFEQTTRSSATLFSENLTRRQALDKEVLEALRALYRNEDQKLTVTVPCRQAWGAGMLCKAPVNFSLHYQKYQLVESIQTRIIENRKTAFYLQFPELTQFVLMTQVVSRLLFFLIHSPMNNASWSGRQALERWMFLFISLDCGDVRTFLPAQTFISQQLFEVIHGVSKDANFSVQKHLLDSIAQHATLAQHISIALRPISVDSSGEQFVELFRIVVNTMSREMTDNALYELLSRFVIVDWLAQQRPSHVLRFEICTLASKRLFQEQLKQNGEEKNSGNDDVFCYYPQVCSYLASSLISLGTFLFPDLFSSFWQILLELTTVSIRQSKKTREKWLEEMWLCVLSFPLDKLSPEESLAACNSLSQLVASFSKSDKSLFSIFHSLSPHILAFGKNRLLACAHFRTREIWDSIWSFYSPWLTPSLHATGTSNNSAASSVIHDFVTVIAANGNSHSNGTSRDIMSFVWPVLVIDILPTSSPQSLALIHAKLLPSSFIRIPSSTPTTTITTTTLSCSASAPSSTLPVYPSLSSSSSSSYSSSSSLPSSSVLFSSTPLIRTTLPPISHSSEPSTSPSALDSLIAAWRPDSRVMGQMARLLGDALRDTAADAARKVQALTLLTMDLLSRANWYEAALAEQKETKSNNYVMIFVSLVLQCMRAVGDLPTGEQEGADVAIVHRIHSWIKSLLNADWGCLVTDATFSLLLQAAGQHQNIRPSLKHWDGYQDFVTPVSQPRMRVGSLQFDLGSSEGRLHCGAQLLLAIAVASTNNSSGKEQEGASSALYVVSNARVKGFLEWVMGGGGTPLNLAMLPSVAAECVHVIDVVCFRSMLQPVSVLQALMYVINHQQASEAWTSSFISHVLSSCYAPSLCLATLTAACRSILSLPLLAVIVEACIDRLFFLAMHSSGPSYYSNDMEYSPRFTTASLYRDVALVHDDLSFSSLSSPSPTVDFANPSTRWKAVVDALEVPEMGYQEFVSACLERGCVYSLLAEEMDRRSKNLETKTELAVQVVSWLPNLKLPLPAPPLPSLARPSLTLPPLPLSLPFGGGVSTATPPASPMLAPMNAVLPPAISPSDWWAITPDVSMHKCVKFLCAVRFELEWALTCGSIQQGISSLTQLTRLLLAIARQQHRLFTVVSGLDDSLPVGVSGVAIGGVKAVFGRLSRFLGYDRVFPELCLAAHAIASFLLMHSSLPIAKLATSNLDFGDFGFISSHSTSVTFDTSILHTSTSIAHSVPQQALAEFLIFTKSKPFVSVGATPSPLASQLTAIASQLHGVAAQLDWLHSKPSESSADFTVTRSLLLAPSFLDAVVRGSFIGFPWP